MEVLVKTSAAEADLITGLSARHGEFLRFVERRVLDRQAAEDILQAAYARAVAQGESLRSVESADAWFYRILRNAVIDYYRHRAVEGRVMTALEEEMDAPATAAEDKPNICSCMQRAIDTLHPAYAAVLREVELSDAVDSLDTFARRNGITNGNAAVRAHRARKALEKSLRHTCGSCAGAGCLDCTCGTKAATHQG